MIGICNGFQVLVKIGLLPDPATLQSESPKQTVTLADNTSGRFVDQWVTLNVPGDSKCIWTQDADGNVTEKPVAELSEGSYFGELALLTRSTRTATIRALTYCDYDSLARVRQVLDGLPVAALTVSRVFRPISSKCADGTRKCWPC